MQQRNIMKKYKVLSACEIDANNFSTSSYFGDGAGSPTVGYVIESESVEDAEKKMKEIWESENKVENRIEEDVEGLTPKLLELMGETEESLVERCAPFGKDGNPIVKVDRVEMTCIRIHDIETNQRLNFSNSPKIFVHIHQNN